MGVYILWETFLRASYNLLLGKTLLNLLSITQAAFFQGFHERLIDPKYFGYQIGAYFILMKCLFFVVTWYLLWSLIHGKLDLIEDYQRLEDISS